MAEVLQQTDLFAFTVAAFLNGAHYDRWHCIGLLPGHELGMSLIISCCQSCNITSSTPAVQGAKG